MSQGSISTAEFEHPQELACGLLGRFEGKEKKINEQCIMKHNMCGNCTIMDMGCYVGLIKLSTTDNLIWGSIGGVLKGKGRECSVSGKEGGTGYKKR
ncbi:hypothetical protein CDAR_284551 [Caerostris darwini]|uniref:Uncharacterized protein n=1 Tax=Caerostris darwini TaxID=1538125 RepID=A0AAV4UJF1_9ARAC|nr:hypothetical protein CDAR_284551 [Caerostris darwini]